MRTRWRRGASESMEDLDRIIRAARHLVGLINDILDISKIEAGRIELEYSVVDIAGLVSETLVALGPSRSPDVALKVDVPEDAGWLSSDATKLRQCLLNLLSNAMKFTERGSITLSVPDRAAAAGRDGRVRGCRHRHRHDAMPKLGTSVRDLRPGGCNDDAQVWRQRAWPRDHAPAGAADGRRCLRAERCRRGVDVHAHGAARARRLAGRADRNRTVAHRHKPVSARAGRPPL